MLKYRPEIDGLRAFAVIPVILFHAGFDLFSGGYVGVDVFFVISGYLITSIILNEKEAGTFTLIGFYERRVRRILPPLFFVMLICIPFSWLWMLPYQLSDFGKSITAVSLFVSNILFFFDTGYFGADAELKPLLHTWSLAVEEQYYIMFPLLLLFLWRLGKQWLIIILSLIALTSLIIAQLGGSSMFIAPYIEPTFIWRLPPSWSFLLAPSRGWELLLGVLISFYINRPSQVSATLITSKTKLVDQFASGVGFLMIAFSIFVFDQDTPYPALYALIPTIGTAFIIIFASPRTIIGRLLSYPVFVGIGLISYSTYLWHQPLFSFARLYSYDKPEDWVYLLLSLGAFVFAYFTWRYIENPFRDKHKFSQKQIFTWALIVSLIFILLGQLMVMTNGALSRYSPQDNDLVGISHLERSLYVRKRFYELNKPNFDDQSTNKVLIIGDSFAHDFVNIIFENNYLANSQIRTVYVPTKCQIYSGQDDVSKFIAHNSRARCSHETFLANGYDLIKNADIIILVSRWEEWAVERLPETIGTLPFKQGQNLILIGQKNFGRISPRFYLDTSLQFKKSLRNAVSPKHTKVNKLMRSVMANQNFVDIQALVCGNDNDCPVFASDGKLLSYDGGHLTKSGARHLGKILFSYSPLQDLENSQTRLIP